MSKKIKIKKVSPIVVYSGSTIQQNHGEMLNGHGYLLWDIKNRTFEEFDIHNDYGFLTIDIIDGVIPQWVYDELGTILPKNPKLRLRFTSTSSSDMKVCISELKKMFKVSEVTITRTDTMGQLRTGNKLNKNIVGNVTDITFQNQLIREYLERQYLLDDTDIEQVLEINKNTNFKLGDVDVIGNILWIPKIFEFDNMFSYGPFNRIDFNNAKDIIGLFAPNAHGKSSLFDALSFCIFDKTSRSSSSKNILNNKKESFFCKFQFEIDGTQYYIERKAKWTRKKTNLKVDVDFWKVEDDVKISLNGEQRRDTNKNIEKYLGKFEDFILTTLSLQGNNALFIDKSQSERKETLSQFIGVDIFDKLFQIAYEENRENSAILRSFKKDDFTSKLANLDVKYIELSNKYSESEKELKSVDIRINEHNIELQRLNGEIVKLNSDIIGIDELLKRKGILEQNLQEIEKSMEVIQEKLIKLETLQVNLDTLLDKYDEDDIKKNLSTIRSKQHNINVLTSQIYKYSVKITGLEERLDHLRLHKYNPKCDICISNNKTTINTVEKLETEIVELKLEHDTFKESLKVENQSLDLIKHYDKEWETYLDLKDKGSKVDREITNLLSSISSLETRETNTKHQLLTQKSLITEYNKNEKQIKINTKIRSQISDINILLKKDMNLKSDITNKLLSLSGQVSSTKTEKENIESRINEVKGLESKTVLYDYYLNALNRDGISYELVEKSLPMIEGEVNNILAQIVDFGIQIDIDGKNINANIVYGDNKWGLEMGSGMERFISGLAIRVALINICNLPRPNFLVIDEGLGTLDSDHLSQVTLLFQYLKTQFDFVIIISHLESTRDMVNSFMEVKRENGFSKIKY